MSRSRQRSTPAPEAAPEASAAAVPDAAPVVPSGDESTPVSAVAADFESGHRIRWHRHRRAQLVYAVEGVMTVKTAGGLWVVPPLRAVWLPAQVPHAIRMTGRVRMRTLYFDPSVASPVDAPRGCTVLQVPALLRELIVRVVEMASHATPVPGPERMRRDRLVEVVLDELVVAPVAPLAIPMPSDERLRRIADALLADPSDDRDAAAWASVAGVSERTLARLFPEQTGMTLGRWRQQVRLLRALEHLALGEAVTTVALEMGYTSTSAFVKLFRENLGVTPGRYFDDGGGART